MVERIHSLLDAFRADLRAYWAETWFVYLIVLIMIVGALWTAQALAYIIVGGF